MCKTLKHGYLELHLNNFVCAMLLEEKFKTQWLLYNIINHCDYIKVQVVRYLCLSTKLHRQILLDEHVFKNFQAGTVSKNFSSGELLMKILKSKIYNIILFQSQHSHIAKRKQCEPSLNIHTFTCFILATTGHVKSVCTPEQSRETSQRE